MSSAKHFTEVLIGGKVYTLSGFEGEEYLQKVSSYLNHKITECANSEGYRKQSFIIAHCTQECNHSFDHMFGLHSFTKISGSGW